MKLVMKTISAVDTYREISEVDLPGHITQGWAVVDSTNEKAGPLSSNLNRDNQNLTQPYYLTHFIEKTGNGKNVRNSSGTLLGFIPN